tara:strand:- start:834 stop:1289 length:456 start_codon:yes stop_codon:yes gene_type:complete
MLSKIEHAVNNYIRVRKNLEDIFYDAGRAERFLAAPHNRNVPSMYQLIETSHLPSELGYYEKKLKLRATPKQMTNYGLAIDLLLMVDQVSEDPMLDRKILWLRAKRNSFSRIGKYLIYHRTTIKRMYDNVLDKLTNKIIKESLDIYDNKFS